MAVRNYPAIESSQNPVSGVSSFYICDLSTDLPATAVPGDRAYAIDTQLQYVRRNTIWQPFNPENQVIVASLSDFPSPVAEVITLADDTSYIISGLVDVGTNRFVCGNKNTIIANDRINNRLTSQTTGVMFTAVAGNSTLVLNNVGLSCPNGDLFSIDGIGFQVQECSIIASKNGGTFNNVLSFTLRQNNFASALTTAGFVFTGSSNGRLTVVDNIVSNNVGTFLALGTAVFTSASITRNAITSNASQTFISGTTGGANISIKALVANNIFNGAGAFAATLTNADANWSWKTNEGITNSLYAQAEITNLVSNLAAKEATANKGIANGYAGLDASGLVPIAQLPGLPAAWGAITGVLSAQTDLQTALDAKEATANKNAASGYAGLSAGSKLTGSQQAYGTGANTACEGNDARLSDSRTPTAHAASHQNGGSDEISVAGLSGLLADGQTPLAHATSHKAGGSDPIKLDELAAPTDVTTLNSSTTAHGLLKKLSNVASEFMDGSGNWSTPAGGSGLTQPQVLARNVFAGAF